MKNILFSFYILLLFYCSSCKKNEVDKINLSKQDVYYNLVEIIKDNSIKIQNEFKKYSYIQYQKNGELSWNRYFFENSILPEIPELKSIGILWRDSLLEEHPRFNVIKWRTNGSVIFVVKVEDSPLFSNIYHYLIYNPTDDIEGIYPKDIILPEKRKILKSVQIKEDWIYQIEKVNWDLD